MILEKLCEFSKRVDDFPPLHFQRRSVDWLIEIDKEGNFIEFVDVSEEGDIYLFSDHFVTRTSQVKAHLLGDKASYLFGNVDKIELTSRQKDTKEAFYNLTVECYENTKENSVKAVIKFLDKYSNKNNIDLDKINNNDWILFRVNGTNPLKLKTVQLYWQEKQNHLAKNRDGIIVLECLVCGKKRPIANSHPEKLKLIRVGGQPGGSPLISANKNSFESYGLKSANIAPICFDCAMKYGKAINFLIDSENNSLKVGDLLYLFWTKTNQEFNGFNILSNPTSNKVKSFIQSVYKGQSGEINHEEFYVLSIGANSSRAVVRDWIQTTLKDIKNNIIAFFDSMKLEDGRETEYYSVNYLAKQTAQDYDDIKPAVGTSIMSYALKGAPLSTVVLFNVVKRIKADVKFRVTRPRAALIKMFFVSNFKGGINVKNSLDKKNQNLAYLCGRLLSIIELIQEKALSNSINTTVVDRYYGTASAAPASVFGNLLRKAQYHLANLRKDESKRGLYYWLQGELEDVMQELNDFPSSLSLKDQSLFALGYYQQKAYKLEKEKQDKEVKK